MFDVHDSYCRKLTKELCDVVENFGLVNFTTLDIQVCIFLTMLFSKLKKVLVKFLDAPFQDKESVGNLVKQIDKTNGYIFAGIEASAVEFSKIAVGPVDWDYYRYPFILYS